MFNALRNNSKVWVLQKGEHLSAKEGMVEECEGLLIKLNPQVAKEKAQEERISRLEGALGDIKSMLQSALGVK